MSLSNKKAYPGMCLGSCIDFKSAEGTYVYQGKIYSNTKGVVSLNGAQEDTVSVFPPGMKKEDEKMVSGENEEQEGEEEDFEMIPREGDLVYARINKVEDRFVRVEILAIEERPLQANFSGVIFKEQVRDYDRDGVQMHKCFCPNDIIKARVVQEASGAGQSAQLTTLEDQLGVVYAWSQQSGQIMVPKSWTEFQCVITKKKEKRKVAKVAEE